MSVVSLNSEMRVAHEYDYVKTLRIELPADTYTDLHAAAGSFNIFQRWLPLVMT